MLLTYKYRIYPTQEQEFWLFYVLEHLRQLHNSARLNRIRAYEEGRFVSYQEQSKILTEARNRHADFKEIPQDFQNHALRRVDKAFANFQRRLKQGFNKPGFPRYRRRIRSLTFSLRKRKDKHENRVRENPIIETDTRLDRLK
ncbi:transposase, partial [Candidatus Poribacteria bacterium]|nr:transposase [Candidatus Poribacteria bacterium]